MHASGVPHVLPLNSTRLTLRHLQAIAMSLELPTRTTLKNLRQMVDRQLCDRGKTHGRYRFLYVGLKNRKKAGSIVSRCYSCMMSRETSGGDSGTLKTSEVRVW